MYCQGDCDIYYDYSNNVRIHMNGPDGRGENVFCGIDPECFPCGECGPGGACQVEASAMAYDGCICHAPNFAECFSAYSHRSIHEWRLTLHTSSLRAGTNLHDRM